MGARERLDRTALRGTGAVLVDVGGEVLRKDASPPGGWGVIDARYWR
jgi:hypothetical protein